MSDTFKKEIKIGFALFLLVYSLVSFIFGLMSAENKNWLNGKSYEPRWDCKPNSIQSMINIPLRLGCELTKQRGWTDGR